MASLIITDADQVPVGASQNFNADFAWGTGEDGENSFSVSSYDDMPATPGGLVYMDGTDVGGVVDRVEDSVTDGVSLLTWKGRTWSGMLAGKILEPNPGQDFLTFSGSVADCINMIVRRSNLGQIFRAGSECTDKAVDVKFDRYINAWDGMQKMLSANGLKLKMVEHDGYVDLLALPVSTFTGDSDMINFDSTKIYATVNHMIGLGRGKGRWRTVVDYYANEEGQVSEDQTFTGMDEITAVYEDGSEDDDQTYGPDVDHSGFTKEQEEALEGYAQRRAKAQTELNDLIKQLAGAKKKWERQSLNKRIQSKRAYIAQVAKQERDKRQEYLTNNSDAKKKELAKFKERVKKELVKLQSKGSVDITVHEGLNLDVGDIVHGMDEKTGLKITAKIAKKILNSTGGVLTWSYEVGSDTVNMAGGSYTSYQGIASGGANYSAGKGIQIAGDTIAAEVSQADLAQVNANVQNVDSKLANATGQVTALDERVTGMESKTNSAQQLAQRAWNAVEQLQNSGGDSSKFVTPATGFGTMWGSWSVSYNAVKLGNSMVIMSLRAWYGGGSSSRSAWESDGILSIPWDLQSSGGDLNFAGANNTDGALAFQVTGSQVNVRFTKSMTLTRDSWVMGVIAWPL